ncbi:hypothetical protein ABZ702_10475, partial [Streptomyces cyaneofuscatus]|uniref:hypothetical protein n=1 Tax=Streptomyces cyaneofuscatus TaxID=66883 RepID=UPI0033CA34C1
MSPLSEGFGGWEGASPPSASGPPDEASGSSNAGWASCQGASVARARWLAEPWDAERERRGGRGTAASGGCCW